LSALGKKRKDGPPARLAPPRGDHELGSAQSDEFTLDSLHKEHDPP